MKRICGFVVACGLFLGGLQSQAFLVCSSGDMESVSLANDLYSDMTLLFNRGVIDKNKLIRANIFLNEAKLCSQAISTQEFCDGTMPLIRALNGRNLESRMEKITLLAEGKSLCENKL